MTEQIPAPTDVGVPPSDEREDAVGPAAEPSSAAPPSSGSSGSAWEVEGRRPPTTMLRAALRPRMLGMLLLLLAAAAVCARLGVWQLDRAHVRGDADRDRQVEQTEQLAAVPVVDVLAPQTTFRGELVGRKVAASGTYDAAAQLLVPGREHDGRTGFLVLTPLRTADGVLPVVRGWVTSATDAGDPPAGPVQVEGYLQASEQAGSGIADGRTDAISSAELVSDWGGPIWTGYVVLSSSTPAQGGLALLDPPKVTGQDLNLQSLGYAAQWWIFGAFAVLLWLRLVRDEARGGVPRRRVDAAA
ncbi:SURF1 family protein [Cellulomonas sp. HZM]|uniref:SURF1 family protein n=1 Tax=Cellulomonas sp. HZM TaxID=1454010 RepID=UPI000AE6C142|nr:SURF1 family protein [Cellulomonas sp. HZM]